MHASNRIAKNGAVLMLSGVVGGILNFVAVSLVSYYLSLADFGTFSFLLSIAMVVQFVADFGLSNILMREMARAPGDVNRLLGAAKGLNWLLFIALSIVMVVVIHFLPLRPTVKELSIVMGFAYLCLFQSVSYVSVLRASERMEFNALGFSLHKVVLVTTVWGSLHEGLGLWGVVCSHFAANLFQWVYFWLAVRCIGVQGTLRVDFPLWRAFIRETLPMGGGLVLRQLSWQSDIFMLKGLSDVVSLGLFSGPFRLLMGLSLVPTFLALPLFPMFVRLATNSLSEFASAYNRTFKFFAIVCFPGTALLFSWPELWLRIAFGNSFIPAAPMLQLLSLTLLPVFMMALYPMLYSAFSKQWQLMAVLGGWLAVRIIAGLLIIPRWGALGSASIVVGCEFGILFTLVALFSKQGLKISLVNCVIRPLVAVLPMEAVIWPFRGAPILQLIPVAILGLLVYAVMVWLIGCLTTEEKTALLDRLNKVAARLKGRGTRGGPVGVLK